MRSRLILIDGLPGSGKSTLAQKLGKQLPNSVVWQEMDQNNPLHVVSPGQAAAAFDQVNLLAAEDVAARSLHRWRQFATTVHSDVQVVESYPYQSGVRLLLQVDAGRELVLAYAKELEEAIAPLKPVLIYLTSDDPRMELERIVALRGKEWVDVVTRSLGRTPWATNRRLSGLEAAFSFIENYRELTQELLQNSVIPRREIPGGSAFSDQAVANSLAWLLGR